VIELGTEKELTDLIEELGDTEVVVLDLRMDVVVTKSYGGSQGEMGVGNKGSKQTFCVEILLVQPTRGLHLNDHATDRVLLTYANTVCLALSLSRGLHCPPRVRACP
jgi:hypothetical protein